MSKIEQTLADLMRQTTEMESRLQALAGRVIALEPPLSIRGSESPQAGSENYWLHTVTSLLFDSPRQGDWEAALAIWLPACAGCDFSRMVMREQKPHFSCVKLGNIDSFAFDRVLLAQVDVGMEPSSQLGHRVCGGPHPTVPAWAPLRQIGHRVLDCGRGVDKVAS